MTSSPACQSRLMMRLRWKVSVVIFMPKTMLSGEGAFNKARTDSRAWPITSPVTRLEK